MTDPNSTVEHMPVTFRAQKEHIEAIFTGSDGQIVGIRLESPRQMLDFFKGFIEVAAVVWQDDPFIQFFLNGE